MKLYQEQARHSMKERLEKKSLLQIVVPENEIIWIKGNKEILLQGKMFDIKSISLHKDDYHISGLFDEKETELVKQWQQEQSSRNEKGAVLLVAFIHLFYFSSGNLEDAIYFTSTNDCLGELIVSLSDGNDLVPTPPPQNVMIPVL
jgi:hypothetical protein